MSRIDLTKFNFSKPRVRYSGFALSKFDLSYKIHDVALLAGNVVWPLVTDIYRTDFDYDYYVTELKYWISKAHEVSA